MADDDAVAIRWTDYQSEPSQGVFPRFLQDSQWEAAPTIWETLTHSLEQTFLRQARRAAQESQIPASGELHVHVSMEESSPYWTCAVQFLLAPEFEFDYLDILFEPGDRMMNVNADVPIFAGTAVNRKVTTQLAALHARINLVNVGAPRANFVVGDGELQFAMDDLPERYGSPNVAILSRSVPVVLQSSMQMEISMNADTLSRSLLKGHSVKVKSRAGAFSKLDPKTPYVARVHAEGGRPLDVNPRRVLLHVDGKEVAFYGTARNTEHKDEVHRMYLQTWAGVEQLYRPHLLDMGGFKLATIDHFIHEEKGPWVAGLSMLGSQLVPRGLWRFLSSDAFLTANNWFLTLSGGMLAPRTIVVDAHVVGMICRDFQKVDEGLSKLMGPIRRPDVYDYVKSNLVGSWENITSRETVPASTKVSAGPSASRASRFFKAFSEQLSATTTSPPTTTSLDEKWVDKFKWRGRRLQLVPFGDDTDPGDLLDQLGGDNDDDDDDSSRRRDPLLQQALADDEDKQLRERYQPHFPGLDVGAITPNGLCPRSLLEDAFLALWRTRTMQLIKTQSDRFVWTCMASLDDHQQESREEFNFSVDNNAVNVRRVSVSRDSLAFNVAAAINLTASVAAAGITVWVVYTHATSFLTERSKKISVQRTLSHRLAHEIVGSKMNFADQTINEADWNILVTPVQHPCHGFNILWNSGLRFDEKSNGRLGIQISAVVSHDFGAPPAVPLEMETLSQATDSQVLDAEITPLLSPKAAQKVKSQTWAHWWFEKFPSVEWVHNAFFRLTHSSRSREVFLYVPFSLVESKVMGTLQQKEVFVPAKNIADSGSPIKQTYELDPQFNYRVRISFVSRSGRIMDTSNWSSEVSPTDALTFSYYPIEMLRLFAPAKVSSLVTFLSLHTRHVSAFSVPMELGSISMLVHLPNDADDLNRGKPEAKARHYTIRAFIGKNSAQALELSLRTGRKIFDEIHLAAIPKSVSHREASAQCRTDGLVLLEAQPTQTFTLERTRTSQTSISFEVLESVTGQLLATGSISFFTLGSLVLDLWRQGMDSMPFTVMLSHSTSGFSGELGLGLCMRDLRRFIRHVECSEVPLDSKKLRKGGAINAHVHPSTPRLRPYFLLDVPANPVLQGSSMVLRWKWPSDHAPSQVYLYLMDNATDELLDPVQFGHPVPNTGSFNWIADVSFSELQSSLEVYIVLTILPWEELPSATSRQLLRYHPEFITCQTNTFFIVKVLPLCELEMAYAGFCRSHTLEMERISPENLGSDWDYHTAEYSLRICKNLRHRLPFEDASVVYFHTPGQCVVSSFSKMVLHSSSLQKSRLAGLSQFSQGHQLEVYKSVSARVVIVEGCQIDPSPNTWMSSMHHSLLSYDIAYHRPILDSVKSVLRRLPARFSVLGRSQYLQNCGTSRFSSSTEVSSSTSRWPLSKASRFSQRRLLITGGLAVERASGIVVTLALLCFRICALCAFPVISMALLAFEERLAVEIDVVARLEPGYRRNLSDLAFEDSFWASFMWMTPTMKLTFVLLCTHVTCMVVIVVLGPDIRLFAPVPARVLDRFGVTHTLVFAFVDVGFFVMFFLWFLVGVLVNADTFMPYIVMIGSLVTVVYMVWHNFDSSRKIVEDYINTNVDLLLSVALDRWFEKMEVPFTAQTGNEDSKISYFTQRIRVELREKRRLTKQLFMLQRTAPFDEAASGDIDERVRLHRERLCTPHFDKVTSYDQKFVMLSDGTSPALEEFKLSSGVSPASRLASIADTQCWKDHVVGLLSGGDVALLSDGVIYGPRYGYQVENGGSDKAYEHAILVTLGYPPAETIPISVKIMMVFEHFNSEHDSYMDAEEFEAFCTTLHKTEWRTGQRTFKELCASFAQDWNVRIDYKKGIHMKDLLKLYRNVDELDEDFEQLFPPLDRSLALSNVDEVSDGENLQFADSEPENDASESSSVDDEVYVLDEEADHDFVRKVLERSTNARKLKKIFEHATQQSRGRVADDLLSDVPFVASKILETHLAMYAPVFGREAVVGVNDRRGGPSSEKLSLLTTLIKTLQMDSQSEMEAAFENCYDSMFEPSVVGQGVVKFVDYVWPSEIGAKAVRLVSDRINLSASEVHESNADIAVAYPPKTAHHVVSFLLEYQVSHRQLIRDQLALAFEVSTTSNVGTDMKIRVAVVTVILVEAGVLYLHDVWEELVSMHVFRCGKPAPRLTTPGIERKADVEAQDQSQCLMPGLHRVNGVPTRVTPIAQPRSKECFRLIARSIEKFTSANATRLAVEDVVGVVRSIVTEHLWFDAFIMLLRLLGINLVLDEIPGSVVTTSQQAPEWIEEAVYKLSGPTRRPMTREKSFAQPRSQSVSFVGSARSESHLHRNMMKVRKVYDELSNGSCFLPVHLADEALLLLNDTRLHVASLGACLQHLKVAGTSFSVAALVSQGDLDNLRNDDRKFNDANIDESLSLSRAASLCDIESDSTVLHLSQPYLREHRYFDWTSLREQMMQQDTFLSRQIGAMCSGSHGFMVRSQLTEFVSRIQEAYYHDKPPQGEESRCLSTSFELFHKTLVKCQMSIGLNHSSVLWLLVNSYIDRELSTGLMRHFIPVTHVAQALVSIFLQPVDCMGAVVAFDAPLTSVVGYKGFVNFGFFRRLLRILGNDASEGGIRRMWDDFTKDPMEVSDFLPFLGDSERAGLRPSASVEIPLEWLNQNLFYLRVEMDDLGLDPTKGKVVQLESLRVQLPKMLTSGLSSDGMAVLFKMFLQVPVPDNILSEVLACTPTNTYGLFRSEDIARVLTDCSLEGMSFELLGDLLAKMQLQFPFRELKRMFDLMDFNDDKSLSLLELLGGFQVLFKQFLPLYVEEAVEVTLSKQVILITITALGLVLFFAFIGLAFSSFNGARSGMSSAIQSVLALAGAAGLQRQATNDLDEVRASVEDKIQCLFGGLENQQPDADSVPAAEKDDTSTTMRMRSLRYIIPRAYFPDTHDPWPCVSFPPDAKVNMSPVLVPQVDPETLTWTVHPRLPSFLHFDCSTGSITGTIPAKSAGMPRTTFVVTCRNSLGGARTRVTFQILKNRAWPIKKKLGRV
ncbi:MAG: hypothetical protein KVP17_003663 [Porospora cf. gigantea B]|uniref:uncharacterized protein n=1 Tax=Porospora cf. gigantea B TaxID=2853592 RepID=UPI003571F0F3|nr:MAG: hypothetical protein KVP17_003663 [Porospora cf. gigantea B]